MPFRGAALFPGLIFVPGTFSNNNSCFKNACNGDINNPQSKINTELSIDNYF